VKVIVCGGRKYDDRARVDEVLDRLDSQGDSITLVRSGRAYWADFLAERWARAHKKTFEVYLAEWGRHGKKAGSLRNQAMLDAGADLLVAFPGGRGTADMVRRARAAGLQILVVS